MASGLFTGLINPKPKSGWHELRFIEDRKKINVKCIICACDMWLPPSKAEKYETCSPECRIEKKSRLVAAATVECLTCKKKMVSRTNKAGGGKTRYWSKSCFAKLNKAAYSQESRAKAAATWKESFASGLIAVKTGPDHPSWRGGKKESAKRWSASGNRSASTRKYRKANPDVVRSFTLRRKGRKFGRLPRGTVERIGNAQRWFCAICKEDLQWSGYHADHIMPLALGGLHESGKIQLLCGRCNVKKWASHPVDYMQKLGYLL